MRCLRARPAKRTESRFPPSAFPKGPGKATARIKTVVLDSNLLVLSASWPDSGSLRAFSKDSGTQRWVEFYVAYRLLFVSGFIELVTELCALTNYQAIEQNP